jgi:hypothetical protein
MGRLAIAHHLRVELFDLTAQGAQQCATLGGDAEGLPCPGMAAAVGTPKPAVALHASQCGVERARAQRVTVIGQFFEQPQAPHLALRRVVEDVDFPDTQPDFTVCRREHLGRPYMTNVIRQRRVWSS